MNQDRNNSRRQRREDAQPTFTGFEDFVVALNGARQAAITVFGPRWDLHPQAYIWARLPAAWVRVRVAGRTPTRQRPDLRTILSQQTGLPPETDPGALLAALDSPTRPALSDDEIGERWSRAPRDQKLPVARFWPKGELPIGPEYESGAPTAKPSKPRLVHSVEPEKRRRPSGANLPSGYEQAEEGFYLEPRWIIDSLLDVEPFNGRIHDPFCGAGNIVGACLQRSLLGPPAASVHKFTVRAVTGPPWRLVGPGAN